jgi:hypothetical protein
MREVNTSVPDVATRQYRIQVACNKHAGKNVRSTAQWRVGLAAGRTGLFALKPLRVFILNRADYEHLNYGRV